MSEENNHLHNYVYSSEVVAFVKAANDCCQFLEGLKEVGGKAFIGHSVKHLSSVYGSVLKIEDTDPLFDSSVEPTVSEQDWSAIYQRIAIILGVHNEIIRPAETDEFDRSDLVTHTISEDVTDVYQELRDFTTIYSRGLEELMNDATWEVKERFFEHWGKKLLRSLAALHDLYVDGTDPESEIQNSEGNTDRFSDLSEEE